MGFAQHTHETRNQQGSGSSMVTFYSLSIRAEEQAPQAWVQVPTPNGAVEQKYGYYEDVWFLNSLSHAPIFRYHETNGRDDILCATTFPESGGHCPACDLYKRYEQAYIQPNMTKEQKSAAYKTFPISRMRSKVIIPAYVPRRAVQKHIHKGRKEILPIYWLTLRDDRYPADAADDYNRLRDADMKAPISQNLYKILAEQGIGKKIHRHFMPIPADQNHGVFIDHPLLTQWLNPQNPAQKAWTPEYHDMMEHLPILQFTRFVDPDTKVPHDYFGYWDKAMGYYEYVKANWPPATVDITPQPMAIPSPNGAPPIHPQQFGGPPQMAAPAPQQPMAAPPAQWTPPVQQQPFQTQGWGTPGQGPSY